MAVKKETSEQAHEPEMLTVTEAAQALRQHPNTVRAWIRHGKLKTTPMGEELVPMLLKSDVEKLKSTLQGIGAVVKEDKHAFPVVGIGASAGGLDAMGRLLGKLHSDLGLSYLLVTHMEEHGEDTLIELLQKKSPIPVLVAENGMRLAPDRLYVCPAGMHVAIVNNTVVLQRPGKVPHSSNRPIDAFFRALASEYQNNAIGILLSGGGMDGTEGLRAIKAEDGLTIAQDASAQEASMPQSAQEAGVVDLVLAPEAIGPQLSDLVKRLFPGGKAQLPAKHENELRRILHYLLEQRGVDFTQYKENTIHRRIIRRMVLSKCAKLSEYSKLLHDVPTELESLYSDLLINVTSFFRDPAFHKALSEHVLPDLFKNRVGNDTLRIWVPACSGGEEVVSISITLLEYFGTHGVNTPVQIFATDLNERIIEKARMGIYKKSALQDMSPERLRQFFQHVDGHYQVIKSIRDMCVFAKHDLLKDPPFSRVDMISCQNVLIYLENAAQGRILKAFHYALRPNGFLALGKSETTANAADLFVQRDRAHKVYCKKVKGGAERLQLDVHYKPTALTEHPPHRPSIGRRPMHATADMDRELERVLLNSYVPASVLVDKDLEIVRFIGPTSQFIGPRTGKASLNLLKMVRDDLAYEVRSLLQRARKEKVPVRKDGVTVKIDRGLHEIGIEVVPMGDTRDLHFLVIFKEQIAHVEVAAGKTSKGKSGVDQRDRRIAMLEQELRDAREQVRLIGEESEVGTQELQAANEEIVSSNEELQSMNEELETSKEELQSINEEFATINEELQTRNDALLESEERYRKLIEMMPVAVHTCDTNGEVRLFNEAAMRLWGRTHSPGEVLWAGATKVRSVDGNELPFDRSPTAIAIKEGRALTDVEIVVVRPNGEQRLVLANPTPLLDAQGRISGAINVLVDITERAENQRQLDLATRVGNLGIWDWDIVGDTIKWTDAVYAIHGVEKGSFVPNMIGYRELIHPDDRERVSAAIKDTLENNASYAIEFRTLNKEGVVNWVYTNAVVVREGGRPVRMLGGTMNITERKMTEERVADLAARLEQALDSADLGTWNMDGSMTTLSTDARFLRIFGATSPGLTFEQALDIIHPDDREKVSDAIAQAIRPVDPLPYESEYRVVHPDGTVHWVYAKGRAIFREGPAGSELLSFNGTAMDVTARKANEERLSHLSYRLDIALDSADLGTWNIDGKVETMTTDERFKTIFGWKGRTITVAQAFEVLHPDDRERVAAAIEGATRPLDTLPYEIEYRVVHPDGSIHWVLAKGRSTFIDGVDGKVLRSFDGTVLDITAWKQAEIELQESEERFKAIYDRAPFGIMLSSASEARVVDANAAALAMLGLSRDELIGKTSLEAGINIDPKTRDHQLAELERTGHLGEAEVTLRHRNGNAIITRVTGDRISLAGESYNLVVLEDITERKAARSTEQRLASIVESSEDAILSKDLNGTITSWNRAAERIFGYAAEEILGKSSAALYPEDRHDEETELIERLKDGDRIEHFETVRMHKNGTAVEVALTLSPLRNERGEVIGASKSIRDITDSKRAREAMRASEEKFHLLADNVVQLVWMAEADGSAMWFNERWREFTGMSGEEIRLNSKTLHHPEHYDRVTDSLKSFAARGERWEEVFPLKGKDGKYHWFLANAIPVRDNTGHIVRWFGTCTDITEQREAQERMRESEERFRLLADNIGQLAWIAEANGDIHWYNQRWFEYTGTTLDEMKGWGWQKIHHPDHVDRVTAKFKKHLEEERNWEDTFPIRGADGEYRWFLSRAFPVRNADGVVERWFGTNTDVTEEREARSLLQQSEERLRMLADNMSQMAYIATSDMQLTWVNKRWIDFTGMDVEAMNAGAWQQVVHPDHLPAVNTTFADAVKEKGEWEQVFQLKGKDGNYRWFISISVPILNEKGEIELWFGTNTDITDQKEVEQELAEVARNKDHFLATLAHELRGPLAPLKNGLQLLEMATDDAALQENIREMMVRQLDHMVRLIDDLMDLSRINQGKVELLKEDVELDKIISTAIETSRPLIDANEHQLEIHSTGSEMRVHGDAARLIQIVANILSNSAKYTPRKGRIELTVRTQGKEVEIEVKDNGIGIAPEDLPKVFDMFTQVGPSEWTASGGGLGIGLNIVSRLVHMHGGTIEAKSDGVGQGSAFMVRMPILLNERKLPKATLPDHKEKAQARRVMIVDDNQDATFSMSMIMKRLGHEVAVANDGQEALSVGADFRPEFVLMDIGMPKMNGYEACAAMRKTDWGSSIHIVALSGWGQEEDRQKSSDAGFDRHIVKPIERATLERVIEEAG